MLQQHQAMMRANLRAIVQSQQQVNIAIKGTRTVRECGPHAQCADRTPHSKPKIVRTRTVIRTSKCAVQMTTNPQKLKKKIFEKIFNFFLFLGLVVI